MDRIVIAFLFVVAVVTQSASPGVNQDGVRAPAVAAQPSRLTEYMDSEETDHNLVFLNATIVVAITALEQLLPMLFGQSLDPTQHSDSASVPLYELHAVWRI